MGLSWTNVIRPADAIRVKRMQGCCTVCDGQGRALGCVKYRDDLATAHVAKKFRKPEALNTAQRNARLMGHAAKRLTFLDWAAAGMTR